ncbi:MAG TPA: hypothetical protein VEC06_16180 [Paucimonas sp.]|nr:hypothetical protein [Paucimonas sp.]
MSILPTPKFTADAALARVNLSPLAQASPALAVPQCTRTFYTTVINGETAVCGMRICDYGNSVSISINCV